MIRKREGNGLRQNYHIALGYLVVVRKYKFIFLYQEVLGLDPPVYNKADMLIFLRGIQIQQVQKTTQIHLNGSIPTNLYRVQPFEFFMTKFANFQKISPSIHDKLLPNTYIHSWQRKRKRNTCRKLMQNLNKDVRALVIVCNVVCFPNFSPLLSPCHIIFLLTFSIIILIVV